MTPEFSRPFGLGQVPAGGRALRLSATPAECAALALRFAIPAVHALSAELRLVRQGGGTIAAEGVLSAEVTQDCVVTLDPVRQAVHAPLRLRFVPEGASLSDDPDGPDEIEFAGDVLELGEAVAEQLALALDPYPRAAGATEAAPEAPTEAKRSAFAALAAWKRPPGAG